MFLCPSCICGVSIEAQRKILISRRDVDVLTLQRRQYEKLRKNWRRHATFDGAKPFRYCTCSVKFDSDSYHFSIAVVVQSEREVYMYSWVRPKISRRDFDDYGAIRGFHCFDDSLTRGKGLGEKEASLSSKRPPWYLHEFGSCTSSMTDRGKPVNIELGRSGQLLGIVIENDAECRACYNADRTKGSSQFYILVDVANTNGASCRLKGLPVAVMSADPGGYFLTINGPTMKPVFRRPQGNNLHYPVNYVFHLIHGKQQSEMLDDANLHWTSNEQLVTLDRYDSICIVPAPKRGT